MDELVGVFALLFAVVLFGFIFFQAGRIINNWVKKRTSKTDEDTFNRMAQAFIQFRDDTNRRLQNIETIITDKGPEKKALKKQGYEQIEINESSINSKRKGNVKSKNKSKT